MAFALTKRRNNEEYTDEHVLSRLKIPKANDISIEPLSDDEISRLACCFNPNLEIGCRNAAKLISLYRPHQTGVESNMGKPVSVTRAALLIEIKNCRRSASLSAKSITVATLKLASMLSVS